MNLIHKIKASELFKITSLNSVSVLLKVFIGLITSKVIAEYVGPSGMALVGNFRNFIASIESFTTLGFQNGIVKFIAEKKDDNSSLSAVFSTLFFTVIVISVFFGIGLFLFSDYLNQLIFGSNYDFQIVFKVLAFFLPLSISSNFLISIVNGFGLYSKVIYINIISSLIGLVLTVLLITNYGVYGSLLSIVLSPIFIFFVGYYFANTKYKIKDNIFFKNYDVQIIKNFGNYFVMVLISGIFGQLLQIAIRNNLINNCGIDSAGFWEAMTRISSYYLLFVNTLISLYFYPKLVVAKNNEESKNVIWEFYKKVIPFFVLGLITVFFLREFIVNLLYNKEFEEVSNLFFWQIIGDFFKTLSWILALQFFVKTMTKPFVISDLLSMLALFGLSYLFIKLFNVQGVVLAYALNYFLYFVAMSIYFRKIIF